MSGAKQSTNAIIPLKVNPRGKVSVDKLHLFLLIYYIL